MRDMRKVMRGKGSARGTGPRVSRASLVSRAVGSKSACLLARAKRVFDIEIEGLKRTRASLGPSFVAAVDAILEAVRSGGMVVVTGVGKSLHVAEKMSGILSSTGTRSFVLNPVQAMHGDLGSVSRGDILIALSFSGESEEILRLIPAVRRHGLKVISMTGSGKSALAALSDVHVEIPCGSEACPFGMAPTNSTTATMAMGDALAMALLDAQKFNVSDYALNHPAGAIGKALLLSVGDVMRTGDRLAKVGPSATVMEALMAMTAAQGGSAVVVGVGGRLLGIFTDGDFRRLISGGKVAGDSSLLLAAPVSLHMTEKPFFVRVDKPAADIVKVFERRQIDDLPVCDAKGRVVGLVDIQDLPKMKVI